MSGFSTSSPCPNCGGDADENHDTKPVSYVSIQCYHCGLIIYPVLNYLTLDELNESRESMDMEPLAELPEQDPYAFD